MNANVFHEHIRVARKSEREEQGIRGERKKHMRGKGRGE